MSAAKPEFVAFFSYSTADLEFALKLARDLRQKGAVIWMDKLDIVPGERWDTAVELAIKRCPGMLVILSPDSVGSINVMDEVSFALEEQKTVIPVLHRDCDIPFRLRRVHRVDVRTDYDRGLQNLLGVLLEASSSSTLVNDATTPAASTPTTDSVRPRPEPAKPPGVPDAPAASPSAGQPRSEPRPVPPESLLSPVAEPRKPVDGGEQGKKWWAWTGPYLGRIPVRLAIVAVTAAAIGTWQFNQLRSNRFFGKNSPSPTTALQGNPPANGAVQNSSAPDVSHASQPDTKRQTPKTAPPASSVSTAPVPNFSSVSTAPIPNYINPTDGLTYLWIPPGTFNIGCSPGDTECLDRERPPHAEQIPGFRLGKTDVTQAAWNKVNIATDPSHFKGDDLPVDSVNWNEATKYCKAIGGRLPSEKEWEYAARAQTAGPRYGSLDEIAWYSANSGNKTHPVGTKLPNAFGLYDTLGNVWQWTSSDWAPYPSGTVDKCDGCKVLRGGSWNYFAWDVRASFRTGLGPAAVRYGDIGFRCAGEFR